MKIARFFLVMLAAAAAVAFVSAASGCRGGGNRPALTQYFGEVGAIRKDFDEQVGRLAIRYPEPLIDPVKTQLVFATGASLIADAADKLDQVTPPPETQGAHTEASAAAREISGFVQNASDRLLANPSDEELQKAIHSFSEPEFNALKKRFDDACSRLQQIANEKDIKVDLGCGQEI